MQYSFKICIIFEYMLKPLQKTMVVKKDKMFEITC